jgi:hypothetical protein
MEDAWFFRVLHIRLPAMICLLRNIGQEANPFAMSQGLMTTIRNRILAIKVPTKMMAGAGLFSSTDSLFLTDCLPANL